MAHLIGQSDIEDVIGVKKLVEHADDDGDGVADANVIEKLLTKADDYARNALKPGFGTIAAIDDLVSHDAAIRNDITELAIGLLGRRREQMLGEDGQSAYAKWFDPAHKRLVAIGRGAGRSAGEEQAGQNQLLPTRIVPDDRELMFGSPQGSPYPTSGGF